MQFRFASTRPSDTRLIARIVNQGDVSGDLPSAIIDGAKAARFKGSAGQVFEGFMAHEGVLSRIALSGAGEVEAEKRSLNVERAGAALAAKYLASGEEAMVLDLGHADLSGEEAASVLLGLRLRSWRFDEYRTKLADDKKVTLSTTMGPGVTVDQASLES